MGYFFSMSRPPLLRRLRDDAARRAGFVLLALSFTVVAGSDLLGQHHCAHHDPGAVSVGTVDVPASAHGHHEAHGEANTSGHQEDGGHAGPCTCIGTCHASAASPLPPGTGSSVATVAAAALSHDLTTTASPAVRLLPYVLPFPNGPPARG